MPNPAKETPIDNQFIFKWKIEGIYNPEWGQHRKTLDYWDFDTYDKDVWPGYTYWSSQFQMFLYDEGSKEQRYVLRSYD
jgi:hypothetical protein